MSVIGGSIPGTKKYKKEQEDQKKTNKAKLRAERAAKQREFIKKERAAGRLGSGKRAQEARNAARRAEILRKRKERQEKKKRTSKVMSDKFAPNIK